MTHSSSSSVSISEGAQGPCELSAFSQPVLAAPAQGSASLTAVPGPSRCPCGGASCPCWACHPQLCCNPGFGLCLVDTGCFPLGLCLWEHFVRVFQGTPVCGSVGHTPSVSPVSRLGTHLMWDFLRHCLFLLRLSWMSVFYILGVNPSTYISFTNLLIH